MTVGGAGITVTISGVLTLEAGATLNNPGTVRVGAFVNNGGTINGNAPVLLGPRPLQIAGVGFNEPAKPRPLGEAPESSAQGTVVLECRGSPGQRFVVEESANLVVWQTVSATILESPPGHFRATIVASGGGAQFFRLRSLH